MIQLEYVYIYFPRVHSYNMCAFMNPQKPEWGSRLINNIKQKFRDTDYNTSSLH